MDGLGGGSTKIFPALPCARVGGTTTFTYLPETAGVQQHEYIPGLVFMFVYVSATYIRVCMCVGR